MLHEHATDVAHAKYVAMSHIDGETAPTVCWTGLSAELVSPKATKSEGRRISQAQKLTTERGQTRSRVHEEHQSTPQEGSLAATQ